MAHIIGLVDAMGVSGCSIIATNLAASLAQRYNTALIDCNTQPNASTSWYRMRKAMGMSANLTLATPSGHSELLCEAERLNGSQEFIVIDAPPATAETTKAILIASQLILIPVAPSATWNWGSDLLQIIEEARARRPAVDARIVWTPFHFRSKSAQERWGDLSKKLELEELRTTLNYRRCYSDALASGLSVLESTDEESWEEMALLTTEIVWILKSKSKRGNHDYRLE